MPALLARLPARPGVTISRGRRGCPPAACARRYVLHEYSLAQRLLAAASKQQLVAVLTELRDSGELARLGRQSLVQAGEEAGVAAAAAPARHTNGARAAAAVAAAAAAEEGPKQEEGVEGAGAGSEEWRHPADGALRWGSRRKRSGPQLPAHEPAAGPQPGLVSPPVPRSGQPGVSTARGGGAGAAPVRAVRGGEAARAKRQATAQPDTPPCQQVPKREEEGAACEAPAAAAAGEGPAGWGTRPPRQAAQQRTWQRQRHADEEEGALEGLLGLGVSPGRAPLPAPPRKRSAGAGGGGGAAAEAGDFFEPPAKRGPRRRMVRACGAFGVAGASGRSRPGSGRLLVLPVPCGVCAAAAGCRHAARHFRGSAFLWALLG